VKKDPLDGLNLRTDPKGGMSADSMARRLHNAYRVQDVVDHQRVEGVLERVVASGRAGGGMAVGKG